MRVKLLTRMAGPNGNFEPGQHDLPDDLANQLVRSGYAVIPLEVIEEKEEVIEEKEEVIEEKEEVIEEKEETPSSRRKLKRER